MGGSRMRERAAFYLKLIMRLRRKNEFKKEKEIKLKGNTFFELLEMSCANRQITLSEYVRSDVEVLKKIYEKAKSKLNIELDEAAINKFVEVKNVGGKKTASIFTDMKSLDTLFLSGADAESKQSVICKSEVDKRLSKKRKILHDVSSLSEKNCYRILKRNPLAVRIGKSSIHSYGLFIEEDVPPNTMIIEYVGEKIRLMLADMREKYNSKLNSSYFFRVDSKYVIDASYTGNYARFINHSCDPNCYAKVIKFENDLKIVIYSLVAIKKGDELTYNYNFPLESEKIKCLCNSDKCKGFLN